MTTSFSVPAAARAGVRRGRDKTARPRIGLFGGTFDPPHVGHLAIAEAAREKLGLERVIFMPSGTPPHKRRRVVTAAELRIEMTRLATRGHPAFTVSTLEARRHGPSYTLDTLEALHAREPASRLYLILGEDSLEEFHTWRSPQAIAALAVLAVAPRGDAPRARPRVHVPARRLVWLDSPVLEVSSSAIRRRAQAGRSLRYLVPDRVAAFIAARGLYRSA